jgi:hypothetical protein
MDRFSRIVLVYRGCAPDVAEALHRGEVAVDQWQPSQNPYDWLGHGICFWEFAPERARIWGDKGGVVGAVIQLGVCLDLMDVGYTALLAEEFEATRVRHKRRRMALPTNRGKRRDPDCLVINELVASAEKIDGITYQTVRCAFLEGEPAFPGSAILRESHVQIVVRDKGCIHGVFRPNLS